IEILDSKNQVVRTFDSATTKQVTARAGSNRFTWDLRYAGAVTFPGIVLRYATPGQGPTAPPGNYIVRLTANGVADTKGLVVQRDPRVHEITDADLQKQFELAIQIRDETARAHNAVLEIREIKQRLDSRMQSSDAETKRQAAQIRAKLDEIEQDLYQT